jgi:hypothetical protein
MVLLPGLASGCCHARLRWIDALLGSLPALTPHSGCNCIRRPYIHVTRNEHAFSVGLLLIQWRKKKSRRLFVFGSDLPRKQTCFLFALIGTSRPGTAT